MPTPIERIAYAASQTARVGWYFGQYALAARMSPIYTVPTDGRSPGVSLTTGEMMADIRRLFERDWANIERGLYKPPHDMAPKPLKMLDEALRFFGDLPKVSERRLSGAGREVRRSGRATADMPDYYLQNFHFQSDGWLSDDSARRYDHQVEVLFSGAADAMRRQALVPLARHLRRHGQNARLLDVATGTGRFLTFARDSFPQLRVTGVDLSPHYLAEARRRLRPFGPARLLRGRAEALPQPDGSQDLVTCIYLFHELPAEVRAQAVAEFARVLVPGGRAILVDSLQLGDRPQYDGLLERFPQGFHEPYYADYIGTDLITLFEAAGLHHCRTTHAFLSKVVTFDKPR